MFTVVHSLKLGYNSLARISANFMMNNILVAIAALILGALIWWLVARAQSAGASARIAALEQDLTASRNETSEARNELAKVVAEKNSAREDVARLEVTLDKERESAKEKLELVTKASDELRNAFGKLAGDALQTNNTEFLKLAQQSLAKFQTQAEGDLELRKQAVENLVAPISKTLQEFNEHIRAVENDRTATYSSLTQQVQSLAGTQTELQSETRKLVQALRGGPNVRGVWGQLQLRRVVEIAGMQDRCDFQEQGSVETDDGRQQRPDMIINLPGGKKIVVDAKAPLKAYLESQDATEDGERRAKLIAHANQVRDHLKNLSSKRYWQQFPSAPDFVVLFLPGEVFFSAALEQAPELIEQGVDQRVILASPTTLISILKAVNYGWQQQTLAENALKISDLGKRLYDSLSTMSEHIESLGTHIGRAVKSYNQTIGSLERNVLVGGRRFKEFGISTSAEIPELKQVQETPRLLQSADWANGILISAAAEPEPEEPKAEKAKA